MRKIKQFELFGVIYESTQLSAVEGLSLIDYLSAVQPMDLLPHVCVVKYDGTKIRLSESKIIDKEVKDVLNFAPPKAILNALMEIVTEHNFGFLSGWKGVKIPSRFVSEGKSEQSQYVEPIIAQLVTSNIGSYKEFEEYYSLYDAFALFDALLTKTVNEAYASEAAAKESKNRA